MADVTTTRTAPAEFIEARGKTFLDLLERTTGDFRKADLSKAYGQQFVAQMDPLTLQAADVAARGPTAYKDYMSPFQQDVIDATLEDLIYKLKKVLVHLEMLLFRQVRLVVQDKVLQKQNLNLHQIETELPYKHN